MSQSRIRVDFTLARSISYWKRFKAWWWRVKASIIRFINWVRGVVGWKTTAGRQTKSQRSLVICWLSSTTVALMVYSLLFVRLFTQPTDQWGRMMSFMLGLLYWVIVEYIIIKATEVYGLWKGINMAVKQHSQGGRGKTSMPKLAKLLEGVRR